MEPEIKIEDYTYNLPDEKIARYPLGSRDDSRILIFRDKNISESKFSNLAGLIPDDSIMVFNNTRVVPARLFFRKESGAHIEIFCLEPVFPVEYALSFASHNKCSWKCVIGNSKRWKGGKLLYDCADHEELSVYELSAERISADGDSSVIEFTWKGDASFSHIIELCGKVPIPPYLKRDTEESDIERYQTLYAKYRGSVAAPTAGLHFTDKVLEDIDKKGVTRCELSLHVGAGTFQPVKSEYISDHQMHSEPFSVPVDVIKMLTSKKTEQKVVAVGTTSSRTLESLYYLGIHCLNGNPPGSVEQWEPYSCDCSIPVKDSLNALLGWMESHNIKNLEARTRIIIVPSYEFKIVDVLITNFHQPQSTLLLLIGAFIGEKWRDIYKYALESGFRFLSYGDSSILFREKNKQ